LVISIPMGFFSGIGGASANGILVKGSNYLNDLALVNTVVFDKTGTLTKGVFSVSQVVPRHMSEGELLFYAAIAEKHSTHPIARSIVQAFEDNYFEDNSNELPDISDLGDLGENKKQVVWDGVTGVPLGLWAQAHVSIFHNLEKHGSAFFEIPGKGVSLTLDGKEIIAGNDKMMEHANICYGKPDVIGSVVYLAIDGVFAGHIIISDEIKSESKQAVSELRAIGIDRVIMLSGDGFLTANDVSKNLGLDEVYADLLPQDKVDILMMIKNSSNDKRKLLSAGEETNDTPAAAAANADKAIDSAGNSKRKLLFVGDGLNDAPVLAAADIGVAMGATGADAAIEAADIVLMTDEPLKLVTAIRIARKTRAIVQQNIVFALGVKALILVLGALGAASMWAAVFGDVGVAVLAILNALRAFRVKI